MPKFNDKTVRVSAAVYEQLQQMWSAGYSEGTLNYCNHTALDAYELARVLGFEQASLWIQQHDNEYQYAQQTGHWGLDTGQFNGEVICRRIGDIGTTALTNVPRTCIHHSPSGHEWGYGGSGPSDLALDILNWFYPPGQSKEKQVVCHNGYSSRLAWDLHQEFKQEFITQIPREGGIIKADDIHQWLTKHPLVKAGKGSLIEL